jgi:hypothetical protein
MVLLSVLLSTVERQLPASTGEDNKTRREALSLETLPVFD